MSTSPPAPFGPQTTPPYATFRTEKRRQIRTSHDSRKHLTSDVVKSFYTGACNDRIRDDVNQKVTGMWLKRREQDTPSEVFTDAMKRKIMDGMLKGRVPAGLNETAVERVKAGCNETATFKKCNLTTIVDTSPTELVQRVAGKEPGFIIKNFVADVAPQGLTRRQRKQAGHRSTVKLWSLDQIRSHLADVQNE
ncbi:hypothetical protein BGZ97_006161 [Linnemannia gamsii]|uniref:Uncharacterized protein n=1 Tax=Linnemannia gamsii TaxID=64522 RepID=A0A9P6QPN4_9FUNG|nr:hypothetical protein BGZ97_006161 [Linnemannia gamsii]